MVFVSRKSALSRAWFSLVGKILEWKIYQLVPHFHIDVDFSFLANTILSFLSFTATIISVPSVQVTEGEGQS